jgi:thiamine kinase
VPFSSNKQTRDQILARHFPHYAPVAGQVTGLSGGSCLISNGQHALLLRQQHQATSSPFRRQYRALKTLPENIAPQPIRWLGDWMAVTYIAGDVKEALPSAPDLAGLLHGLHQQPLFGWRNSLLPLLEQYWLTSTAARRTPLWLHRLKIMRKQGEPRPLRLAPLHMDVHAGNLVHSDSGLRLIDWEYAGDGDVAMELASVWLENETQRTQLIAHYALLANINPETLQRQVGYWRPWILMLMAGWYEQRLQQTGDRQFILLADATWHELATKRQER